MLDSLPVADFTPIKDHRRSINRWNAFVLGGEYIKQAARLHPKSKESVDFAPLAPPLD